MWPNPQEIPNPFFVQCKHLNKKERDQQIAEKTPDILSINDGLKDLDLLHWKISISFFKKHFLIGTLQTQPPLARHGGKTYGQKTICFCDKGSFI